MALGESYGGTDVMHDRRYLQALLLRGPRDPMFHLAQQALESMDRADTLNQQAADLGYRKQAADETRQARIDAAHELELGRNERAGVRADLVKQAQSDRRTQGLVAAMNMLSYDQTPEGKKALASVRSEYLKDLGIGDTATQSKTTTVGEYGPGGAQVNAAPAGSPTPVNEAKAAFGAPPTASTTTAPVTPAEPAYDYGSTLPSGAVANAVKTVNADGSVTTHLPSGGTATAYDRSTPQGLVAINSAREQSSKLQGIPFVPVAATRPTFAANVPTNENVTPNAVPYVLPQTSPEVAKTVPTEFGPPIAQPAGAPSPAPGVPQPSVFGPINFNTGAAPAATPGPGVAPVPTPAPNTPDLRGAAVTMQQAQDYLEQLRRQRQGY